MRSIFWTNQFKKDFKRAKTQGKDIVVLRDVITKLASGEKLPEKYKDHLLRGQWTHHRDCHIKSDWVLIYRIDGNSIILERMGSHSELFR